MAKITQGARGRPCSEELLDDASEPSVDVQGLLHVLLHRSWIIILLALVGGLAAEAYVRQLPVLYQSTTVIEVDTKERKPVDVGDRNEQNLQDPEVVETIIENFHHRALMERVAKALDLANDPKFLGPTLPPPASNDSVVGMLLSSSTAALQLKTRLVNISFVHRDPIIAQKVADALVKQFLQQNMDQRIQATESQNDVLRQKADELKAKLTRSEEAIQEYKQKLQTVSVEEQRNLVEAKLKALNTDLSAANTNRITLESDQQTVKSAGDSPQKLFGIASIAQDPQVVTARQQVDAAENELASLLQRYHDKWPAVIEQRAQVENARKNLKEAVLSAPARLDARYRAALAKEQSVRYAVAEQEKAMLDLENKMIPYRALLRENESDKSLFESVLQQLKQNTLAVGVQAASFHVVEPAVPAKPAASKRLLIVIGAALAAAVLSAGIIALFFLLNSSIRTVDDAESALGLPVLTAVSTMRKARTPGESLPLVHDPGSPIAESFRTLRSAILLLGNEEKERVILFTSALPGEGKSFVATNTAVAFAQQDLKTLLVEADLRKPAISKRIFELGDNLPGVADYMVGQPAPVQPTLIKNLYVMPAGSRVPNPAELLANLHFNDIIDWLKHDYDRIVIDTAPINVVSDTLNIVACASVICLVVRSNLTPRKAVRRAVELLRRAKVRPDGIVLNGLPRSSGIGYHYYYSTGSKYGGDETYGSSYSPDDQNGGGEINIGSSNISGNVKVKNEIPKS